MAYRYRGKHWKPEASCKPALIAAEQKATDAWWCAEAVEPVKHWQEAWKVPAGKHSDWLQSSWASSRTTWRADEKWKGSSNTGVGSSWGEATSESAAGNECRARNDEVDRNIEPSTDVATTAVAAFEDGRGRSLHASIGDGQHQGPRGWLELYCLSLPADSFSEKGSRQFRLSTEDREFDRATHRATVSLPPQCPIRKRFCSDWLESPSEAEHQAIVRAVTALQQAHGVGEDQASPEYTASVPTMPKPGNLKELVNMRADMLPGPESLIIMEQEDLQNVEHLHLVEIVLCCENGAVTCGTGFGFLVSPAVDQFKQVLQFHIGELTANEHGNYVRLQIHELSFADRYDVGMHEDLVFEYHRRVTLKELQLVQGPLAAQVKELGTSDSCRSPWLLLRLENGSSAVPSPQYSNVTFAWDAMKHELVDEGVEIDMPNWLISVVMQWHSLADLDATMQQCSPVSAVPDLVNLKIALFGGCIDWTPSEGESPLSESSAFEIETHYAAMALLGKSAQGLYVATKQFKAHSGDDAKRLEKRVERVLGEDARRRLAQSVERRGLLDQLRFLLSGTSPAGDTMETVDALFGAYYNTPGGGFSSVARLSSWLSPEATKPEGNIDASPEQDLVASIPHLLHGQDVACDYKGRTPSYMTLQQIDDEESVLRVKCETGGVIEYRRAITGVRGPEERQTQPSGQWAAVKYDPALGANVSPTFSEPVANKVSRWLDGQPLTSLIGHGKPPKKAPAIHLMHEYVNKATQEVELQVEFIHAGTFVYSRSRNGNIGLERQSSGFNSVIYSEEAKTLCSPGMPNHEELPNTVIQWLRTGVCLAHLVASSVSAGADAGAGDTQDLGGSLSAENGFRFRFDLGAWGHSEWAECHLEPLHGEGYVYRLKTGEELQWDAQLQKWVMPHETGKPLPDSSLARMKRQALQEVAAKVASRRSVLRDIDLAKLQRELQHEFDRGELLAEANTHSAAFEAERCSNDRLAFLGGYVVEALIAELLVERLATTSVCCARKNGFRQSGKDAFSEGVEKTGDIVSLVALKAWWHACCNHAAYACSCVRLSLHEEALLARDGVPKELQDSAMAFAEELNLLSKEHGEDPWPSIQSYGAPRALGDLFLANLAATFLDGTWRDVKMATLPALRTHMDFSEPLAKELQRSFAGSSGSVTRQPGPGRVLRAGDDIAGICKQVDSCLNRATLCKTHMMEVLTPPRPPVLEEDSDESTNPQVDVREHVNNVLSMELSDVHLHAMGEGQSTCLVLACSPRAAQHRAIYASREGGLKDMCAPSPSPPPLVDQTPPPAQNTQGEAVHCPDCDMWLNGPTQWEDHKIGKKHIKNTKPGAKQKPTQKKKKDQSESVPQDTPGAAHPVHDHARPTPAISAWGMYDAACGMSADMSGMPGMHSELYYADPWGESFSTYWDV